MILILAGSLAWVLAGRRRYDLARKVCREQCRQAGLQLLDDSVSFRRRFAHQGRRLRSYSFEWSRDGQTRQRGSVWLDGEHVEYLSFDDGGAATLVNTPLN